jgi:hypothetical protein
MPGTILDDLQEGLAQLPAEVTPAGRDRVGRRLRRPRSTSSLPTPETAMTPGHRLLRSAVAAAAVAAVGSLIRSMVKAVTR